MSIEAYTAYRRASRRRSSRTPFNPLRSIENEVELTGDINAADSSDLQDVGLKIRTETFTDLYTVEADLGRGKFATVKKCRCNVTGEVFAAKIQRKRRKGVDARQELIHEIRMLALCKIHPRIIGLKEVFENRHEIIIIMKFASGGELYRHMEENEEGCSEAEVRQILRQTLEGLAFLHQRNIVHMDIKPQNLLLSDTSITSDILLCDLGFSRTVSNDKDVREIVGTPDFVAPEVLNYEPISTAVDMWSVGVLTYMLLSGCSPFAGADKMETFSNITQARVDFPEDLFQHTSDSAKDFVDKLLQRNPSGRLTATECLDHPWLLESECSEEEGGHHNPPLNSLPSAPTSTEHSDNSIGEKQDTEKVCCDSESQPQCIRIEEEGEREEEEGCEGECSTDDVDGVQECSSETPQEEGGVSSDGQTTSSTSQSDRHNRLSDGQPITSGVGDHHTQSDNHYQSTTAAPSTPPPLLGVERRGPSSFLHAVVECEILPPLIEECEELPPLLSKAQKDICNARKVHQSSPLSSPVGCRRTLAPSPETVRDSEPIKKHLCRRGSAEVTQMLKVQHTGVLDLETVDHTDTSAVVCKRGGSGMGMGSGSSSVRRTAIKTLPHTKSLVTFYENLLHHS